MNKLLPIRITTLAVALLLVTSLSGCELFNQLFGDGMMTEGEGEPDPALELSLARSSASTYTPGAEFVVTIDITSSVPVTSGEVTALGLRETIPAGWTFVSVEAVSGGIPAVTPSPGQETPLEFAWIDPPQFPYTFRYTVQVPGDATGSQNIIGQFEYRLDGGAQIAPSVVTTIDAASR